MGRSEIYITPATQTDNQGDPKAAKFSSYIQSNFDWDEDKEKFIIPPMEYSLVEIDPIPESKGLISMNQQGSHSQVMVGAISGESKTCSKCDRQGHLAKDCRGECSYCGKGGHNATQCKERIRNEKKDKGDGDGSKDDKKRSQPPITKKKKPRIEKTILEVEESDHVDEDEEPTWALTLNDKTPKQANMIHQSPMLTSLLQRVSQLEAINNPNYDDQYTDESECDETGDNETLNKAGVFQLSTKKRKGKNKRGRQVNVNQIRARAKTVRIARVSSDVVPSRLKPDSEADVHIVPTIHGMTNIKRFNQINPCPLRLETADGTILKCIGRGDLNEFVKGVYICPEVQSNLISLQELQKIGLGVVFPPLNMTEAFGQDGGVIIYDAC